ncbi:hypothetical protein BJ875DRAFT_189856 [Amylocarpus encephaloides]|uniref:Uncharacterized protein n=1 Tax=Amylocarpus encephaloides TaxID=45428 RepID=A0A9P8CAD3_9HELO|nr:hypothetical protein BJ875DRAFT_189856 [Amylocarpus encephaloides]
MGDLKRVCSKMRRQSKPTSSWPRSRFNPSSTVSSCHVLSRVSCVSRANSKLAQSKHWIEDGARKTKLVDHCFDLEIRCQVHRAREGAHRGFYNFSINGISHHYLLVEGRITESATPLFFDVGVAMPCIQRSGTTKPPPLTIGLFSSSARCLFQLSSAVYPLSVKREAPTGLIYGPIRNSIWTFDQLKPRRYCFMMVSLGAKIAPFLHWGQLDDGKRSGEREAS